MKQKRIKFSLMLQITLIVVPLLIAMVLEITYAMYQSTIEGFLNAQNSHMKRVLREISNTMNDCFFSHKDTTAWVIDNWEKYSDDLIGYESKKATDEKNYIGDFMDKYPDNIGEKEWREKMPEDLRRAYARFEYEEVPFLFKEFYKGNDYESIFWIDVSEEKMGTVIADINISRTAKNPGERYDIDLADHPGLSQLLDSQEDVIVFDRADNFPVVGNCYIGYVPIFAEGKIRTVIGVVYNWDDIRDAASTSMNKALIISIGSIVVVLGVLIAVLYIWSVCPAVKMQRAVNDYAVDKKTPEIVKKMYSIKANNELGDLADVISDMALEIDLYNKETARIASEKERAEKELYEAQVSVMVSQIQPHFMYNALSSIAMMCELDPEKAQEATVAFADYLRGNMDSLKQKEPVPFEKELSHLKNYLAIEKMRFGRKLNIKYDIQTSEFVLPALSIQPLVENAVKHGVGQKKKGGTVTIATRETEDAFEVIVSDDGVGFDVNAPKKKDGRSHVGMENTRKRLKDLCGAEVITTSVIGEGTTTRVILPKEGQKNEDIVL